MTSGQTNWGRAIAVWLLIVVAESMSGTIREVWVLPLIGDRAAHQVGVLVASVLILFIAWLTIRWLGADTRKTQLQIGLLWVVLFLAFEFGLGAALGTSRERMLADYDFTQGGLMVFGFVFLLFAPMLAARLRGTR
jgi:hypothetical protein